MREQQIREIHDLGVEKVYLHLDGWADPGYDNQHPDYTPACQAAGGWEDMKSLVDTMHDFGYKFGIHDQYRRLLPLQRRATMKIMPAAFRIERYRDTVTGRADRRAISVQRRHRSM